MPPLLIWNFDKENNSCVFTSSEKWITKAYLLTWKIVVVLSLVIIAVLYSKVAYTLWLKRNDDHQLLHRQRVSVNPDGRGGLPNNGLLGMCRWMGSHLHAWINHIMGLCF